ncbi:MAG: hypothetical protein PHS82_07080 [Lachnospiraceae bacterium]|nr:hypothetical protein [Lachnospiraceae bacterium]
MKRPQYFSFLFHLGNIQIDLDINENKKSDYRPFTIYKEQILKLLANSDMPQSKKEDLVIALFAYVHGLTALTTMKNVYHSHKWEDKLDDLIKIFSCEF